MLGSNVAENMSRRLCLSRSEKSLSMKAAAELSIFLVMGPLIGSDLLEWGWKHSVDLDPYWFPMLTQYAKADSRLSGEHGIACAMVWYVVSIVTGS